MTRKRSQIRLLLLPPFLFVRLSFSGRTPLFQSGDTSSNLVSRTNFFIGEMAEWLKAAVC